VDETDVEVEKELEKRVNKKKPGYFRRKVDSKMKVGVVTDTVLSDTVKGDKFPVYLSFRSANGEGRKSIQG
jgi:hypothetical protein